MNPALETALIALTSAALWGGGDFCGGMGVRRAGRGLAAAVRFVVLAYVLSLFVLLLVLWRMHATLPHGMPVLWAVAGGVAGALGLTAFYMALSRGAMGAPAAVSGLLATAIPVTLAMAMEGSPGVLRLAGFAVAFAAIWLIAAGGSPEGAGSTAEGSRATMGLAGFSGVAFGLYLISLRFANPLGLVMPMAIARSTSVILCLSLLVGMAMYSRGRRSHPSRQGLRDEWGTRSLSTPSLSTWSLGTWSLGWAAGVAVLDTGGNMMFVAATRVGRLDVASVLASLYPAGTILLAAWHLQERPTRRQLAGMATALVAVVMITL